MSIKKINSEIVYSNPWISVRKDKVQFKDQSEGEYGVVHHKAKSVVVMVEKNGSYLVVYANRYVFQSISIEFPAGLIEDNETPEDAAKREVFEETGIEINNVKHQFSYQPSNGTSDQEIIVLKADYKGGELKPDFDEVEKARWMNKEDYINMLASGSIVDGPTLTASLCIFMDFMPGK